MTELAKDYTGIEFASKMIHETIGGLLKLNNDNKKNENKQVDPPEELDRGESSSIVNLSTEIHLGTIITTGAVDNRKETKRAVPRGSPSKYKK